MYYRERETNPKAAEAHNKSQIANAKDRLAALAKKKRALKGQKAS